MLSYVVFKIGIFPIGNFSRETNKTKIIWIQMSLADNSRIIFEITIAKQRFTLDPERLYDHILRGMSGAIKEIEIFTWQKNKIDKLYKYVIQIPFQSRI